MSTSAPTGPTLVFGNANPQVQVAQPDGSFVSARPEWLQQSETSVQFWDGVVDPEVANATLSTDNDRMLSLIARSLSEKDKHYAVALLELEQLVSVHTGGDKPRWIDCDDKELQRVASAYFNCAEGRPTALFTNAGRDALHAQHMTTGAQPAAFNYIALTANATAPAATDTTLTGEIATGGGGLIRAQATYAHTTGTNTSTLTKTFTANGSDSLPVTVAKIGVFNASSVGTLGYTTLLSSTATLSASGDSLTITETITAG